MNVKLLVSKNEIPLSAKIFIYGILKETLGNVAKRSRMSSQQKGKIVPLCVLCGSAVNAVLQKAKLMRKEKHSERTKIPGGSDVRK
jgi:hypothetical protein